MSVKETRYYKEITDDFEESADQNFKLPTDYKWIRTDFFSKALSFIIYTFAVVFSSLYCPLFLHMKIKNKREIKKKMRKVKNGCFIYCNHTQPFGDVFIPALCVLPKRIYTVVSPANYGIPVIGKILPYLGALPTAQTLNGIKELEKAIEQRLSKNHPVVIFPEAHVWEYCSFVRPFPATSMKLPVKYDKPTFTLTVTYQKSKVFKKPKAVVFMDGPFYGEGNTKKEKVNNLHKQVFTTMTNRAELSTQSYIEYKKL